MRRTFTILIMTVAAASIMVSCKNSNGIIRYKSPSLYAEVTLDQDNGATLSRLATMPENRQWTLMEDGNPLFEIQLKDSRDGADSVIVLNSTKGWSDVSMKHSNGKDIYTFTGNRIASLEDGFSVEFIVTRPSSKSGSWYENDALTFNWGRIRIPDGTAIEEATLLPFDLTELPKDARALMQYGSGIEVDPSAESMNAGYSYPAGFGAAMPWNAVWDGEGSGLYLASHNSEAIRENLFFSTAADGSLHLAHCVPGWEKETGNCGLSPTTTVLAGLHGDWFEAAVMYRDWVKAEASWYPRGKMGPEGRTDTPQWLKELCVWGGPYDKDAEKFQEAMGIPVGLHLMSWHQIPFDNDYPHYYPAKEDFEERLKQMQAHDIYVVPYMNARLWDTRDKGLEEFEFLGKALPGAIKDREGRQLMENYGTHEADGDIVRFAPMCPASDVWQQTTYDIVTRMLLPEEKGGYGADGMFMDQITACAPAPCFDPQHGHQLGDGPWWVNSYCDMLDNIRKDIPDNAILTSESNAESYARSLDALFVWQLSLNHQVPAFNAVYESIIQTYARSLDPRDDYDASRTKLAQAFIFGEQLGGIFGWPPDEAVMRDDVLDYLGRLARLRYSVKEYFYKGEMVKRPSLVGDNPKVFAEWYRPLSNATSIDMESVLCSAWSIPSEGRTAYLFANCSDNELELDVRFPAAGPGKIITRYDPDAPATKLDVLPAKLHFAPQEAFVIELTDE